MTYIIAFVITICLALWTQHDARQLRAKGVHVVPGIWSTLVFFGSLPLFMIYLLARVINYGPKSKEGIQPLQPAPRWTNWLTLILAIIFIGGIFLTTMTFSSLSRTGGQGNYVPSGTNGNAISPTTIFTSQSVPNSQVRQGGVSSDEDVNTKRSLSAFGDAHYYYGQYHSYSGGPYEGGVCNLRYLPALNASSTCKSSATAFAWTASLGAGGFWCVDSAGYDGEVSAPNAGTSCVR